MWIIHEPMHINVLHSWDVALVYLLVRRLGIVNGSVRSCYVQVTRLRRHSWFVFARVPIHLQPTALCDAASLWPGETSCRSPFRLSVFFPTNSQRYRASPFPKPRSETWIGNYKQYRNKWEMGNRQLKTWWSAKEMVRIQAWPKARCANRKSYDVTVANNHLRRSGFHAFHCRSAVLSGHRKTSTFRYISGVLTELKILKDPVSPSVSPKLDGML